MGHRTRAIGLAAALALAGCGVELHRGLDERQANEVVAELDRQGVAADKRAGDPPGTFEVRVQKADLPRAVTLLQARDLPRGGGRGVAEAFAEPGLLPSPGAERARLQAAIATDLERTLQAIPGVALARVHLALPDADPLRPAGTDSRATASILLRTRGPLPVPDEEIRRMTANAAPDLAAADVRVVYAADESPPATSPAWVTVGPLAVAPASRGAATLVLGLLGAAVVAIVALGAAVLVLLARLRSRRD